MHKIKSKEVIQSNGVEFEKIVYEDGTESVVMIEKPGKTKPKK